VNEQALGRWGLSRQIKKIKKGPKRNDDDDDDNATIFIT
jgi:hypothetical protein